MTREEKNSAIEGLAEKLSESGVFYLADTSEMSAEDTTKLRRACFKNNVSMHVVKNSLLVKAMEKVEGKTYEGLADICKGPTSIMFSETGNVPAKVIKDFRKKSERPILKAAYVEEAIYLGDDQLEALTNIKSKEELVGEIIGLLQSPAKNLVSALQNGGPSKIANLLKAMSEEG